MSTTVNLYEAKTNLSGLVERPAGGEDIVIAKNGRPRARLIAVASSRQPREPVGALNLSWIAADFDAPDPEIAALFED